MRLTDARRRGLEALLAVHPNAGRRSNDTRVDLGYVYWQTADWLVEHGLANLKGLADDAYLSLTDAGYDLAEELGRTP